MNIQKNIVSLIVIAIAGMTIASCRNAMFTEPQTSDWFITNATFSVEGNIFSDHGIYPHQLDTAKVFIAWEIPDTTRTGRTLYVFDLLDTVAVTWRGIFPSYSYHISLGDSLPAQVVRLHSSDTLAVGHVFLSNAQSFKNGDLISYDSLMRRSAMSQHIIAALEDEAVIYRGGKPTLNGNSGIADTLDDRHCGYGSSEQFSIVHGDKFPGDKYFRTFEPDSGPHDLKIEDNPQDVEFHIAFWLQ